MNYTKDEKLICIKEYAVWISTGKCVLFKPGNHYIITDANNYLVSVASNYANYKYGTPLSLNDIQEYFEKSHVRRSRIIEELIN